MPELKITVTETIEVPEGSEIVLNAVGTVWGIRLPTGELLKPWTTYEVYKDQAEDAFIENATYNELQDLGVETGVDYERDVDVIDGEVPTVESE